MQNQIVTNTQPNILDLAPLHDAHGAPLVLRPKGQPGDAKEVTATTAAHEIVERVKKARWVVLSAVPAAVPPPPAAPPASNKAASARPKAMSSAPPVEAPPAAPVEPVAPVVESVVEAAAATSTIPVETSTSSEEPIDKTTRSRK